MNVELQRNIAGSQGESYYSDLEKMERVSSSLITEVNVIVLNREIFEGVLSLNNDYFIAENFKPPVR